MQPPGKSQIGRKSLLLAASMLTVLTDLTASSSPLFVLVYAAEITLAALLFGRRFAYLIAALASIGGSSDDLLGIWDDGPSLEMAWGIAAAFLSYFVFAVLIEPIVHVIRFVRPRDNALLEREHVRFPELYRFVFHPYLNAKWGLQQRLRSIDEHYRLVGKYIPLLADLPPKGSIDLGRIELDGDFLRIVIDQPRWIRREGEVGISLFFGIDRIYVAMFTLATYQGQRVMLIGNLQGDRRQKTELYKRLTKASHGLRPRDLLFQVVQMVASEIGCSEIWGISDGAHRNAHLLSSGKKISGYNEIWLEHDGLEDAKSGFFRIPVHISRRSNEDIPSNKRAQYRRRYQLLDEIELQIRNTISATRRPA